MNNLWKWYWDRQAARAASFKETLEYTLESRHPFPGKPLRAARRAWWDVAGTRVHNRFSRANSRAIVWKQLESIASLNALLSGRTRERNPTVGEVNGSSRFNGPAALSTKPAPEENHFCPHRLAFMYIHRIRLAGVQHEHLTRVYRMGSPVDHPRYCPANDCLDR